jgi:predicted ATP-grasp superfamily ATP-dependent carboligase
MKNDKKLNVIHTTGPWEFTNANHEDYIDIDGENGRIASIFKASANEGNDDITEEEHEANARLIVAAPKMLEALVEAYDQLQSWNTESEDTFTMKRVLEAIDKATRK